MEKVLIFRNSKQEAGWAGKWYEDVINSLNKIGFESVYIDLATSDFGSLIQSAVKEKIAFALTLTTAGLNIKVSENEYLADKLNIPFICWQTDLFLSPQNAGMYVPLKHLLVGCLNEDEVNIANKLNPFIKSAFFLPLGGSNVNATQIIPIKNRAYRISLCANYYSFFERKWNGVAKEITIILNDIIDLVMANPLLPIINAAYQVFNDRNMYISDDTFRLFCNKYLNLANLYIRSQLKLKLVETIVKAGLAVDIYGADVMGNRSGWRDWQYAKYVNLHGPCNYEQSLVVAANSQIVLNAGIFPGGLHDRVSTGMLNGAVVVTDPSAYYNHNFIDGEDSVSFDWQEIEKLPAKLTTLLADTNRMQEMADCGRAKALKYHTWDARVKKLVENVNMYKAVHGLI